MTKTVLVVDDDSLIRRSLVSILQQSGFTAIEAQNGKQGLEKATTEDVDLIVTDLNMPEMNGMEMTENLRKNSKTKDLRVIILTTDEDTKTVNKAMRAGVTTYLSKTMLDLDEISKHITRALL